MRCLSVLQVCKGLYHYELSWSGHCCWQLRACRPLFSLRYLVRNRDFCSMNVLLASRPAARSLGLPRDGGMIGCVQSAESTAGRSKLIGRKRSRRRGKMRCNGIRSLRLMKLGKPRIACVWHFRTCVNLDFFLSVTETSVLNEICAMCH